MINSAPDFSLFLWGVSATPLFLAVEEFRRGSTKWGIIYCCVFAMLVSLGFLWPNLPAFLSGIFQARASTIFGVGAYSSALLYAFVRLRWVKYGDRRLISGFGEGLGVYVFVSLVALPWFEPSVVGEIISKHGILFILGGLAGLALVFFDGIRREETGKDELD